MRRFLFTLIPALLLVPMIVQADIAPAPGTHEFSTHAAFDNLTDYPAYDVYASDYWLFGPSPILATDEATTLTQQMQQQGHLYSTMSPFFAVKKSDQAMIVHREDPGQEQGDIWAQLPENERYMINGIVTGEGASLKDELTNNGILRDSNPAVYVVWVYHIDSLTDTSFTAHFVKESRYDSTGAAVSYAESSDGDDPATTDARQSITNQDQSSPTAAPTSSVPYLKIVMVALGAVIIVLVLKKWKR